MRTNESRLYLRPSKELNEAILAILGRALARHNVRLHAFVFLSNHWHALVTVPSGKALSGFLRDVHSGVAKAAQRINGVKGKVWQGKKATVIPVLDDEAQLRRLRYLLAHGTKEGLVASPTLWPGLTSARALLGEEALSGTWIDHKRLRELRRSRPDPHPTEYITEYPIELAPLPVHEGLSAEAIVDEVRTMVAEIEAEHPGPHLGVDAVLAQDPQSEPRTTKRGTIAPLVHTTSDELRNAYSPCVSVVAAST